VGAFFNTLNHLDDEPALRATFAAFRSALRPGGTLLFDVNNALGFETWWRGHNRYEGPGWSLEIDAEHERASTRAHARFEVAVHGEVQCGHIVERLFSDTELDTALRGAGFEPLTRDPWAPQSDGVQGATFWTARRAP
jgi:SAM-dependent methyltransferase